MEEPATSSPSVNSAPRRVLLLGAGPLPSAGSAGAPGVANRLWQFAQPAVAAGHECLVLILEDGAPRVEGRQPEEARRGGLRWQRLAVAVEDFKQTEKLAEVARKFDPQVVVSAGTLQAGATACALAGDRPVWVDLFGDPLAEIQAKASLLGGGFDADEHVFVWEMMLGVLMRGDAFSTVSRRQRDALLGQLLLLGMTDGQVEAAGGSARTIGDLIAPMPCAVESLTTGAGIEPQARAALLAEAGLPADAQVALWSGGFNAWADPPTLVRGMELAMARNERLRLVVTGGALPGYLTHVYRTMEGLVANSPFGGRFHLLGWLPLAAAETWAAVADAGVLVDRPCAETRLGARNRLLTHAAAFLPVVATRGTEVVEEMEAAGALAGCDAGRPEALAETLEGLLRDTDRRDATARRALEFCRAHYTFAATNGKIVEFIEKAAGFDVGATDPESDPSAAEWIAACIDPVRRRAEWAELARYRAGRWQRLRQWLTGGPG
jgi:glycosyltransferase involved in cell wall biosynthesis